jgi:NAD(P)-dependent dehydrogenase (short-subunit alcohol dehydrogenase family)
MSNRLPRKVCIITGTGGGMGREAALTFAREGALVSNETACSACVG